jgi:hypothetical protein
MLVKSTIPEPEQEETALSVVKRGTKRVRVPVPVPVQVYVNKTIVLDYVNAEKACQYLRTQQPETPALTVHIKNLYAAATCITDHRTFSRSEMFVFAWLACKLHEVHIPHEKQFALHIHVSCKTLATIERHIMRTLQWRPFKGWLE